MGYVLHVILYVTILPQIQLIVFLSFCNIRMRVTYNHTNVWCSVWLWCVNIQTMNIVSGRKYVKYTYSLGISIYNDLAIQIICLWHMNRSCNFQKLEIPNKKWTCTSYWRMIPKYALCSDEGDGWLQRLDDQLRETTKSDRTQWPSCL